MTVFLDEVNRQPPVLRQMAEWYAGDGAARLNEWRQILDRRRDPVFIGMGTSEHSPLLVIERLVRRGHRPVIHDAGEFLHYLLEDYPRDSLFVLLSQSGESVETRKVAEHLAGKADMVVITNHEDSTMGRLASLCLPLRADREKSITNQTYLNTLGLLYLMTGGETGKLREVADSMQDGLDTAQVVRAAEFLQPAECVSVAARGPSLAAARQIALTLMEGARVKATAFPAGAFRHGPFEVTGPGHRAIVLAPRGRTETLSLSLALEMTEKGSRVLLLTDSESPPGHSGIFCLKFPHHGEECLFACTIALVQGHLLHHVARLRGFEAGVFESISKVTTRE